MPQLGVPNNQNIVENIKTIPGLVKGVVDQYIVRPTGDPNLVGISGFIFDIIGGESVSLESDITDHFVERNIAIQDHVALRPERFSLAGYVGELSDIFQNTLLGVLTKVQSLGDIGGLAPNLSAQATEVYSKVADGISKAGEVLNQTRNIYDIVFNRGTFSTKQQRAYVYFYQLWLNRQLCSIETPFGVFEDMIIERLTATQDESTNLVSDFAISFKKIRRVRTIQFSALPSPGRAANTISEPVNQGQTGGLEMSNDLLSQSFVVEEE